MSAPAIKTALALLHLPANLRRVRREPLPDDIEILLRIAAGDETAENAAAQIVDRPRQTVREAAVFYIEQVLLHREADCYRVLGANPSATMHDLRRNMALLLTWLHPDKNPTGDRAALAARVTGAWTMLRAPDRRAAYDAGLATAQPLAAPSSTLRVSGSRGRTGTNGASSPTVVVRSQPMGIPPHMSLRGAERQSLLRRGLLLLRRLLRDRTAP
jgi:hypothetical protein